MTQVTERSNNSIPLILFGVPLHNLTFTSTLEQIDKLVASEHSKLVATANLDFHRVAAEDPEMQRILFDADIMMADGFPMVKLSPFFGPRLQERVTGSDITPMLAEHAAKKGHRLFFLGAAPGVAQKAADILMAKHPGLNVVGCYSPEKADIISMKSDEIMRMFEETKPDVLLVAFGAPKQEKWIQMHRHQWKVPVAMGIGGSFDFIAGAQVRSPVWMQKLGLEWLGRLLANPKRLAGRYMLDGIYLLKKCAQFAVIRLLPIGVVNQSSDEGALADLNTVSAVMKKVSTLEEGELEATRLLNLSEGKNLVLVPERVQWLNSVELGIFVYLARTFRQEQRLLVVCPSSRRVSKLLHAQGLQFCFTISPSLVDAAARIKELAGHPYTATVSRKDNQALQIILPPELTAFSCSAASVEEFGSWKSETPPSSIHVDASLMHFIDCGGLARLVDLKNRAEQEQIPISFRNFQPKPAQIIRNAGQEILLN